MHGNATQIQKHRVDSHRDWLTAWSGAGKLITIPPTKLLRLAGSGAVVDEPITLARGGHTCIAILPLGGGHTCPEGEV
jgi:hypothetical protein